MREEGGYTLKGLQLASHLTHMGCALTARAEEGGRMGMSADGRFSWRLHLASITENS